MRLESMLVEPRRAIVVGTLALLLCAPAAARAQNLVVNPGAETGDLTGWFDALGNGFNVDPGLTFEGSFSFTGGLTGQAGQLANEIAQDVDVSTFATAIDAGVATASFEGYTYSPQVGTTIDVARVVVEYLGAGGSVLLTANLNAVFPTNQWNLVSDARTLPTGTRTIRVRLITTRDSGGSTDGRFDAMSVEMTVPTGVPSMGRLGALLLLGLLSSTPYLTRALARLRA